MTNIVQHALKKKKKNSQSIDIQYYSYGAIYKDKLIIYYMANVRAYWSKIWFQST